ncbi:small subunit ribosomal protein S17 [Verrucomicrobium sp. GAS474]|uniref:30S ribosomal protein S17 n=1 Tax=Verrucomicrobium sp. GAS474 TaxID=1882831 RepID=UPI00087D42F8|nr:30S ribosomal protein S17 [Verrucomicrobium sp. GAS474]SDU26020.1 small subunit ribosomal protein S17 [Verrucomicrobium sp. GAS474]
MTETAVPPETAAAVAHRKEQTGTVVSTKMSKTIVVRVDRRVPHPQYKKIVNVTKKFYAHDAQGTAKEGDRVLIRETRPLSRLKRWELVEVLKH